MSLAGKQKLATLGGLKAAQRSQLSLAVDGNLATIFKSESSLLRGQAILVDLQMVYALTKIEAQEEAGHDCLSCVFEVSCDQKKWSEVHAFTPGENELVAWNTTREAEGYGAETEHIAPTLARFVRVRATAPNVPEHWGLKEFFVFGNEMPDSIGIDARVFLSDQLKSQAGHPASFATDDNTKSAFKSLGGGKMNDAITVDLQDVHTLSMVEVHQPKATTCRQCVLEGSLDGKSWQRLLHLGQSGVSLVAYGPKEVITAQYVRLRLEQALTTVWEIDDLLVYGTPQSAIIG
jgi:hypothetical protein